MARVNKFGYVERKAYGRESLKNDHFYNYRSWWLVKHNTLISLKINMESYAGKRVRFKVEVIE